jgi:membrane protein
MSMAQPWYRAFYPKQFWLLVKEAFGDWSHDRAPRLGAALAYYTVFSIVPLLIIIIAIIGLVFGEEAAHSAIMDQISSLVGGQSAAAIKDMIQRADQPSSGLVSTVFAVAVLLFGAAGFFGQLKAALDTVWGVEAKEGRGIWGFVKDNFLSFAAVLGTAFLLLVSLVLSTALAAMGKWLGTVLPLPEVMLQLFNFFVSFVVITGLFAMIFKVLPEAQDCLAGCMDGGGHDRLAVHDWEVCDRSLPWEKQRRECLWRRRIAGSCARLGLLLRPNPVIRSRIYPSVCQSHG